MRPPMRSPRALPRVLWILLLLTSVPAWTQCTLSGGASMSAINSAESSAGSGSCGGSGNNSLGGANSHTVFWNAGNYSISSTVSVPNGAWNVGPTISPWTNSTQPTAILTGGPINANVGFYYN